jgi:hypothetical protein
MSGCGYELAARAAEALVRLSALANPAAAAAAAAGGGGGRDPVEAGRQEWSGALDSSLVSMKGIIYGEKDAAPDPVAAQQLREALLDVRASMRASGTAELPVCN